MHDRFTKLALVGLLVLIGIVAAQPYIDRYVLSGDSPKNAARTAHYPKRLTACELAGLTYGPFAYLRSRHRVRRQVLLGSGSG